MFAGTRFTIHDGNNPFTKESNSYITEEKMDTGTSLSIKPFDNSMASMIQSYLDTNYLALAPHHLTVTPDFRGGIK
jgi:hypothetical protein